MNTKFLIVANWKMNLPHDESIAFVTNHYSQLSSLAENSTSTLVLCPSFTALYPIGTILKETSIKLGAQDCSNHLRGAFTGQISAQSLKSLGCSYCIVGHSDRRRFNGETSTVITQKAAHLVAHGIMPIICIGENKEEHERGETIDALEAQLTPILDWCNQQNGMPLQLPLYLAYEPLWAIGSGAPSNAHHLEVVFSWLHTMIQKCNQWAMWRFLYGGSISGVSAQEVRKIHALHGLLVGQASLDFQELKKIVE